jgi:hypothetical protein
VELHFLQTLWKDDIRVLDDACYENTGGEVTQPL